MITFQMCPPICPHFNQWVNCDCFLNVSINLPTFYPLGKLWSLFKCAHQFAHKMITGYIVIAFAMCPSIWSQFAQRSLFDQIQKELCNVSTKCLSHSLRFLSKCTLQCNQPNTQRILWEFFESSWENWTTWWVHGEFIAKYPLGILWSNCWIHFERSLNEWLRHFVDTLQSSFWIWSKSDRWANCDWIDGHIAKAITMYPVIILWANWWAHLKSNHNMPSG